MELSDLFSLRGKTAIVTGATGDIGIVLSKALAEAGADIVAILIPNDPGVNHLREQTEQLGRRFQVFEANLKDYKSIPQTFESIWNAGVTPDILLNCAGITRTSKVEETPIAYLDDVTDLNFKAAYVVSQEFGKRLLKLGRPGKIIHIASMAAFLPQTEIAIYSASKAAVRNLTTGLSNEWAQHGIRVNCISPGFIHSKMTESLFRNPETSKRVTDRTSARRWGYAEDLIGVTILLASKASDFITGESIVVDGGVLGR